MRYNKVLALIGVIALTILIAGCVTPTPPEKAAQVTLLYANVGQMPQLLATGQVDGYMAWQPFVSVADVTGLGTIVSYSQNLPPEGIWEDHSCDSLVARDVIVAANPDTTQALATLLTKATDYTAQNPERAAEISAEWIFGRNNLTFGNISVDPIMIEKASIPTIKFTNDPSPQWQNSNMLFIDALKDIGYITGSLANATPEQRQALLYNFNPYNKTKSITGPGQLTTPSGETQKINIGYLLSDHDAPFFVAIKEWRYFNDTYGVALRPVSDTYGKVDAAELIVNGAKVADVQLVRGDSGAQLMTLMGSNSIDFAVAGTPPTITAIDKGTPIKILFPMHTEGSGLVVSSSAPVKDWNSFITWVQDRSTQGKPVKIAVAPKGSIQDVQLSYALEQSGITVSETQ
jgi:ABC-type nitrate/sulfonate/bicarbonate transport system substrate-binding protein